MYRRSFLPSEKPHQATWLSLQLGSELKVLAFRRGPGATFDRVILLGLFLGSLFIVALLLVRLAALMHFGLGEFLPLILDPPFLLFVVIIIILKDRDVDRRRL